MPTFYQRLQEYKTNHPAAEISQAKLRRLTNILKFLYDKNPNKQPMIWVESVEGEKTCRVRHYPDCFTKTIDEMIRRFAEAKPQLTLPLPQEPPKENVPEIVPKERKRIPVKSGPKPIYSSKNVK